MSLTKPLMVITADVEAPWDLGQAGAGGRRCVPITGGKVTGEVEGEVMPGADWQTIWADGTIDLSAHYALKTASGAIIEVESVGLRAAPPEVMAALGRGERVDASRYYFRTAMRFRTSSPEHARLNKIIAFAVAERAPRGVTLTVHEVL